MTERLPPDGAFPPGAVIWRKGRRYRYDASGKRGRAEAWLSWRGKRYTNEYAMYAAMDTQRIVEGAVTLQANRRNMTERKPTDPAGRIACLLAVWLRRRTNLTNRLEALWRAHCAQAWPLRVAGYHYIVYRRDSTIWLCDIALWLNERGI